MLGLTEEQAQKLLKKYGYNIQELHLKPWYSCFVDQFKSAFILLLLFAVLVSLILGNFLDSLILISLIFISAVLGFFQEFRANKALESLYSKIEFFTKVYRNGELKEINSKFLVPGDVIYVTVGDIIQGDGIILESKNFSVNESVLTGESYPVPKKKNSVVYKGTNVMSGWAKVLVKATGPNTEFGKISKKANLLEPEPELTKNLKSIGNIIFQITLVLVALTFIINLMKNDILSVFMFSIVLAVGLVPELLPVVSTISLSLGGLKLAKKHVVVKKLASIYELGRMQILCCDKTGTLTEGTIRLADIEDFSGNSKEYAYINSYFLDNRTFFENAILKSISFKAEDWEKVDELPFDYDRRMSTVLVKKKEKSILIVKGDPEKVLKKCKNKPRGIFEKVRKYSLDGYRVLALASKEFKGEKIEEKEEENLCLDGLLIFHDPLKPSAKQVLKQLKKTGVSVKILTGDFFECTKNVCDLAGFEITGALSGEEIEKMSDSELLELLDKVNVYYKMKPSHKLRIVLLLRSKGYVVGALGDGVNDAPLIKAANVGISVKNGSDITKDVASIILLQKDLKVLHDGIIEGRKIYENVKKYLKIAISGNFGNMVSVAVASFFLPFLPLLPKQVLFVNFLSDFPELAISRDNVDEDTIDKPTHIDWNQLKSFVLVFGLISSCFDLLFFSTLLMLNVSVDTFRTSWFVMSVLSACLIALALRTKNPLYKSKPNPVFVFVTFVSMLFAILSPVFLSEFFQFTQLNISIGAVMFIILSMYIISVEVVKYVWRKFEK
ncbi:MAG: HAD-IC family P-type ATPase [archaeon]